ncbi:MAG: hypothetical protein Q9212_005879 [Teloschistes hypoglaucus]
MISSCNSCCRRPSLMEMVPGIDEREGGREGGKRRKDEKGRKGRRWKMRDGCGCGGGGVWCEELRIGDGKLWVVRSLMVRVIWWWARYGEEKRKKRGKSVGKDGVFIYPKGEELALGIEGDSSMIKQGNRRKRLDEDI